MTFDDITAVIVTRGDVPLDPIIDTLPYSRIIVWNNAEKEWDAKTYGRFLAAEEAETEYVYFADDDLIFRNHDMLLAAWEPDKLIVNMPSPWYEYCEYDVLGQALVGAGSLCPVGFWREAFERYLTYWPKDDLFLDYCDFIFGRAVPHVRYDFGYEPFEYADAPGRIFNHPYARQRRSLVFARTSLLKGDYDAEWYDEVMVEDGSPAMEPLEESPWITPMTELAKMLDPYEQVVDLGCGTGRFVELLYRRGHYEQIWGVDWSQASLDEAARYVSVPEGVPPPIWVHADLSAWQPDPDSTVSRVYVCSEVLEHLLDDRALVAAIPQGHRFLFTVPNFNDHSHVRVFRTHNDIWERYGDLLEIRRWVMSGRDYHGIHICEARRR